MSPYECNLKRVIASDKWSIIVQKYFIFKRIVQIQHGSFIIIMCNCTKSSSVMKTGRRNKEEKEQ